MGAVGAGAGGDSRRVQPEGDRAYEDSPFLRVRTDIHGEGRSLSRSECRNAGKTHRSVLIAVQSKVRAIALTTYASRPQSWDAQLDDSRRV